MPDPQNAKPPGPIEQWLDRRSRQKQALLLALLMFAVSAGTFLLGLHGLRSGERITNMAGRSDWSDMFLCSAFTFALGAALLAVAMGWIQFAQAKDSETQPRR